MNELEKLKEEIKSLKTMLGMKDAYIELMEKTHQAEKFMISHKNNPGFSHGGYIIKGEDLKATDVVMPTERKTIVITINGDGTMSKTEDYL